MKYILLLLSLLPLSLFAQSLNGPESVEYDHISNRWFISNSAAGNIVYRDGAGNLNTFATGISPNPYGIEMCLGNLYAACGGFIKGFDMNGTQIFNVNTGGSFLNGLAHDFNGNLYATDFNGFKIYKISTLTGAVSTFVSGLTAKPNGIIWDQINNRLVFVSWGTNASIRAVSFADSTVSVLSTSNMSNCDGIATDGQGNFYISYWGGQSIRKYTNDFSSFTTVVSSGLSNPADIYYSIYNDSLGVPNSGNNTVTYYNFSTGVTDICNALPLQILPGTTTFGASDGLASGADSMITFQLKNASNYPFAYPMIEFTPIDPLPSGMTFHSLSAGFSVFASAWNPGITLPIKCYFNVSSPLQGPAELRFKLRAANLAPANTDTCSFTDTIKISIASNGVGTENPEKTEVSVYPNPAQDKVLIRHSVPLSLVQVYDLSGKVRLEVQKSNTIDLSLLPASVYMLRITDAEGNRIQKKLIRQ